MYQVFGYEYDVDDNLISRDYNAYYGNGQLQFSQQYTFVYDDDGNEIRNDYVSKEYYKNGQLRYEREIYDYMNGTFIHASADSNDVCTKARTDLMILTVTVTKYAGLLPRRQKFCAMTIQTR